MESDRWDGVLADDAQAWRDRLSLRLLRSLIVLIAISLPVVWFGVHGARGHVALTACSALALLLYAVAAVTRRPRGAARAWLVCLPAVLISISGYVFGGALSGPGACLAATLMLTGLLLGRRAMIGLTLACAGVLAVLVWAIVNGHLPAPDPRNSDMTSAFTWVRSLGVTFLAVILFGALMVAVISRMEQSLRLALQETRLREHAERGRAEAERLALESKQLEVVGRLAAGIAHDFNNNLTAIMGCAELLRAETDASGRELADSILQSSRRVAELTRQLLAYSRKAQMQQVPTDLHCVVNEAVSLVRRSFDPNVRVVLNLAAKTSTVAADVTLLQSAILNLLVNAGDAMPEGGTLTLSTTSLEMAVADAALSGPIGPCILLEVVDTGRGIEKELLARVFEPFFTTKPIGQGTGLGLAAVAGTIKTHGGRIEVESEIGIGTAFRITLPLMASASARPTSSDDLIVRGQGEILLVEDDAMVSLTAAATLRSLGYGVTHVSDGGAALDLVRTEPRRFGLVLLDLRMPGPSGETTFDAIREVAPALKVLIWSGYVAEHDVSAMLRRGAIGFVQKPYRVAELSRVVAEALR